MVLIKSLLCWGACLIASAFLQSTARATDVFWSGGAGTNAWGSAPGPNANWSSGFTPEAQFAERGVIGTDSSSGLLAGESVISAGAPNVGGIALGLREIDSFGEFVNPEPAAGSLTGQLTISGGTVKSVTTGAASFGADGRVLVGVHGRGYLTMTGGTLNTRQLVVAGEENTSGLGNSTLDLSGNATISVSNAHQLAPNNVPDAAFNFTTLSRNLKITGPNVNFSTFGRLTLSSTNVYTAEITSPTDHSALKTDNIAVVGGALNVQFSGAGTTHTIGETWDLVDAAINIAGTFSNVGEGGTIGVTGLPGPIPLGATYRVQQVEEGGRTKLQLLYDRTLVLQVNRDTGQMTIRSPQGGSIGITGYTVKSPLGSLLTSYAGISGTTPTPPDSGWSKPSGTGGPLNTASALTEVKAPDFTPPINDLDFPITSTAVPLGTGFSRTAVGADASNFGTDGEDLTFEYETLSGFFRGQVEYVGTRFENNLVLRVNPTSGQAFLKNDSLETLVIDGYSILSATGSLSGGSWTGLGGSWEKSPADANALSETNPVGSITLAPNGQVPLGDIGAFPTTAAQDGLSLKFILAEGLEDTGELTGDFDNDGDVDGRDFLVWQRGGSPNPLSSGDLADWQAGYAGGGTGGNPPEDTYRLGAVVFDSSAGSAVIASVPEPSTVILMASVLSGLVFARRTRLGATGAFHTNQFEHTVRQIGASGMSRRMNWCAALLAAICGFTSLADRSSAVTQAIPLVNGDFELPGPAGTKVVAFGETGIPFAPTDPVVELSSGVLAGGIPGWTFTGSSGSAAAGEDCAGSPGVGCETFGDGLPGDSGTEGKGAGLPGNELLLSTVDGKVYQTSTFSLPAAQLPSTQKLLLTFEATEIYTPTGEAQLTAWLYYVDGGGLRQTIGSPLVVGTVDTPLEGRGTHTLEFVGGSAALTPALGRPIGVTFDTTSREFDATAVQSWTGVDNVLLEIAGTLPGDINGDGTINLTDYRIIRDNLEETHSYLFEGDIVRDGIVDLNDFRAWKSLPPVINSGVLAEIAAIPEPSSIVLILSSLAIGGGLSRRRNMMSRKFLSLIGVVAALGTVLCASSARAELLAYDPFLIGSNPSAGEYMEGTLGGEGGTPAPQNPTIPYFTDPWDVFSADATLGGTTVQSTGLSFLGAPAAGGSLITSGSSRAFRHLATPFDDTTLGTYYLSFLVNFGGVGVSPTSSSRDDVGHRAVELLQVGGDEGSNLRIGYTSYNGNFNSLPPAEAPLKFGPFGQEVLIAGAPASFIDDNGSTHLVVIKFTLSDQAAMDSFELFLDPTDSEEPVVADASFFNRDFTLDRISGPVQFGGAGTQVQFDELRIADTYVDVLPEFPLKGDTNGDDLVDMTDYQAIYSHLNLTGQSTANGDVTGDGRVDLRDIALWRAHRTDTSSIVASQAAVPEPSTLLLAVATLLGLYRRGALKKA